jgi:hypothetical protein
VVMVAEGNPTLSKRSEGVFGILGILIPVGLFIALKGLHEPKGFHFVSISSDSPEEPHATLAELARAESALIHRAHIEIIALTLLAFILLCFLFSRSGIPKWTKYLMITAAAASLAASWLQW